MSLWLSGFVAYPVLVVGRYQSVDEVLGALYVHAVACEIEHLHLENMSHFRCVATGKNGNYKCHPCSGITNETVHLA